MSAENAPSVYTGQKWSKRPKQTGLPESVGHRERAAEPHHSPVQTGAGKQDKKGSLLGKGSLFLAHTKAGQSLRVLEP